MTDSPRTVKSISLKGPFSEFVSSTSVWSRMNVEPQCYKFQKKVLNLL